MNALRSWEGQDQVVIYLAKERAKKVLPANWHVAASAAVTESLGKIIGEISQDVIAVCLSFAAGAMLYIVSGELIPESNKIYDGKASTIGTIIGFILGLIAVNI